uniref:Methyltransferase FkbM domain-containing protein n=1 Tax=Hemiselmis tepida TaxID=464990 RepID=A0A7S0YPS8_9CRYP|mmetsp:Transcript_17289/g.43555  ORF Transcript_17289/g.43555 Transcript_17289/m.43555 type:complete len:389 (+) Transcript_17289:46-1212(+)
MRRRTEPQQTPPVSALSILSYVATFFLGVFLTLAINTSAQAKTSKLQLSKAQLAQIRHLSKECPPCPFMGLPQAANPPSAAASPPTAAGEGAAPPKANKRGPARAVYALPHLWCPHGQHGGGVDLTAKTLSKIPPGQLVIDVGAYDGSNAIMMARAGHRVLSFEPTPSKAKKIKRSLANAFRQGMSGSVKFYPWAASNFSGTAPFVVNVPVVMGKNGWEEDESFNASDTQNMGSEQDGFTVPWQTDGRNKVDVKVEALDNVVGADETVLFMKVDAQGHDFRVLQGARRLLGEQRVLVLLVEFAPTLMPGGAEEAQAMLEFLGDRGYRCFGCGTTWPLGLELGLPIDFGQWSRFVKRQTFAHRGANHGQWDDLVCVADSARTELREAAA